MIKIRHLQKSFGQVQVLKDISTEIRKGECVCVIGPSGSGKSTFLRCINLLEQPDGGSIEVDGRDILDSGLKIDDYRKEVGMVFQHFNLFPNMTVKRNIMLAPMRVLGLSEEESSGKALKLLRQVGLESKADTYPNKLSGGQKQRVAIARALINDPVILLADEPTGNLDKKAADEIMELLLAVNRRGNTVLLVTHEQRYADLCGRKIEISDGKI